MSQSLNKWVRNVEQNPISLFCNRKDRRQLTIAFWDMEADVLTRSLPQTEPTHSNMGTLKYSSRPSGLAAPWVPGDSYLQNTLSCIS